MSEETAEQRKANCPQDARISVLENSLVAKIDAIQSDTAVIKACLFGNGKPGLRLEVDRQEQWRLGHIAGHNKWDTRSWLLLTLVVGNILALLFWPLRTLFARVIGG